MWLLLAVICCLALSGLTQIALAEEVETSSGRPINVKNDTVEPLTVLPFDIPRQRADGALTALGQQADITVVYRLDWVKPFYTNALKGNHTLPEAVKILLVGTGLTARLDSKDHLIISQKNDRERESMNYKKMNSKKTLLAATIGFFMGSGVHGVVAQDEVGGQEESGWVLEEVVVTAQKREERLIDVPISISVLNAEMLKSAGIQDIHDLSYVVPNLSVLNVSPSREISIRGISNGQGSSSLVGIYLDELPATALPNAPINLQAIDLQRVEVLKGPQGTLYGQGSVGGTIRFVTKTPTFNDFDAELGLSASVTEGGDWNEDITSIINIPAIKDTLAFRLAATYKDNSGWIDQPSTNTENANDTELSFIRLNGLWRVSSNLSLSAMAVKYQNDGGASDITNEKPTSKPIYTVPTANGSPLYTTDFSDNYDLANLTIDYDLGFATLISSSSHFDVESFISSFSSFIDVTFFPGQSFNQNSIGNRQIAKGFTQELRLTGHSNSNMLDWTVGLFYNDSERTGHFDGVELFLDGAPFFSATDIGDTQTSKSVAIFGDISYSVNDKLTISIGTRYFEDKQEFKVPGIDAVSSEFDNLSSRFSLSYSIAEDTNLFLSISEGFRSGGLNNPVNIGSTEPAPYDPETVLSYELGAKASLLDRKLNLEGAIFQSDYSNYQSISADPTTGLNQTRNATGAQIQGVEWAARWTISKHISLGFNANITEAEFSDIEGSSSTYNVGDQIDFVPKYGYSLNADFDFNWSSSTVGFARLDFNKQGGKTNTLRASGFVTEIVESNPIGIFNAQIGAQWESVTVKLFGRNLSNEDEVSTAAINNMYTLIRPRTIGLDINYRFGS